MSLTYTNFLACITVFSPTPLNESGGVQTAKWRCVHVCMDQLYWILSLQLTSEDAYQYNSDKNDKANNDSNSQTTSNHYVYYWDWRGCKTNCMQTVKNNTVTVNCKEKCTLGGRYTHSYILQTQTDDYTLFWPKGLTTGGLSAGCMGRRFSFCRLTTTGAYIYIRIYTCSAHTHTHTYAYIRIYVIYNNT